MPLHLKILIICIYNYCLTRSYSNMHLYNLTCLTYLSSFFSYKKLSKKFATCAISYLSCQIHCSKNYPINSIHCAIVAMPTVQYTLRQPAKKCCPSHVHYNILLYKLPKNVVLHTTKSILA